MRAREWLARGNQASDPIDAFTNFWLGFNNLYFVVGNSRECDKIRLFLSQRVSEAQAEEMLEANIPAIDYLLSEPVIDMRGYGRDTTENITAFNSTTSSLIKLQEVFMVIYQVRCNLVHGQKSPNSKRDVLLCQCASPLVAQVVDWIA
jgi:hypothetical protein